MRIKKNTKKHSNKLVAAGVLLASTAFGSGFVLPIYGANTTLPHSQASYVFQSQSQEPTYNFNIQADPLDKVLIAFQNSINLKVQATEDLGSLFSPGVVGTYTAEEALKELLKGTNVTYSFISSTEVKLSIQGASEVIEIVDNIKILNSPKFTEPLRDTPQSISIVSKETLEDQAITTLRDALKNVAGVSIAAGEGGNQGDNLTIRGFGARNDLFIDGMRDFGNYYRDPFNVEQIEVLKGPSSVTLGRGSTGGAVNQTYKAPQLRSFVNGTLEFGSDETKRATIDINEPLPKLGKNAAFRLNILGHYAQVAERDIAETRRYAIAPSLALGIGQPTSLTVSYFHQSSDDVPDYGLPYLFDGPAPVARNNYYGFKNSNFLKTKVDIGTIKVEHQFNESFGIRNQTRYTNYSREALITAPRISGTPTLSTPLSQIKVLRNQVSLDTDETFLQNQFDVTAKFRTGFIKYTVVGGIEGSRETSKPSRFTITGVPLADLLNPDTNQAFSGTSALTSKIRAVGNTFASYFLTTINLADKLEFVGGVRYDRFDVDFEQFIGTAKGKFNRLDKVATYKGAVVYKPMTTGSIYFSYSTSFNPSAEAFALSAATTKVAPEENRTFEVGTKWDLLSSRFSIRGAAFRIEKTNARETDPTNALLVVLSGEQKVDGFELETTGRIADRLQINSSYAFLDSELVASKFFPKAVGSRLANVPKHTGSLTTSYSLPWRLDTGFTVRYVGSRNASATTPLDPLTGRVRQVKGYTVADMFVKRAVSENVELQVNIYNLSNKFYIDQVSGGHLVPGAGRSVKVGLNFKLRK